MVAFAIGEATHHRDMHRRYQTIYSGAIIPKIESIETDPCLNSLIIMEIVGLEVIGGDRSTLNTL